MYKALVVPQGRIQSRPSLKIKPVFLDTYRGLSRAVVADSFERIARHDQSKKFNP